MSSKKVAETFGCFKQKAYLCIAFEEVRGVAQSG